MVGAATGAAVGAVYGGAGRGAAAGAAAGVVGSTASGMFRKREPSPTFMNFVNRCLHEKGYEPIGWEYGKAALSFTLSISVLLLRSI